jgi:hypothetical protein
MPPCNYLFFSKRKEKKPCLPANAELLVATEFHTTNPTPWPRLTSPRSQKLSETTPELRQADLQRSPLPTPAATEPHRRRLQTHMGRSPQHYPLFSSLGGLSYQPVSLSYDVEEQECASKPPGLALAGGAHVGVVSGECKVATPSPMQAPVLCRPTRQVLVRSRRVLPCFPKTFKRRTGGGMPLLSVKLLLVGGSTESKRVSRLPVSLQVQEAIVTFSFAGSF